MLAFSSDNHSFLKKDLKNCRGSIIIYRGNRIFAGIAQLVEQLIRNEQVACSSHVSSSNFKNRLVGVVPVRIQRQFYSPYGEFYCFAVILCFAQCYSLREFAANKITLNPQDSITLLSKDNNITLPQGRITHDKN